MPYSGQSRSVSRFWATAMLACVMLAGNSAMGMFTLVQEGEPQAVIVLPSEPQPQEKLAADELVEHIRLISGAELPVIQDATAIGQRKPIFLGAAADPALKQRLLEQSHHDGFVLRVTDADIAICGSNPISTLFGVYELLEQLGVRWYAPGDFGRVLPPKTTTLALPLQDTMQIASMQPRRMHGWVDWNGPYALRQRADARDLWPHGAHNLPGRPPSGTNRQHCLSGHHAPGALEAVVGWMRERLERNPENRNFSMGPLDGGGYCRCEGCVALDGDSFDPLRNSSSMTDRYIWFFNRVLEELEPDYPDVHIGWYVYSAHFFPPEHTTPNPRIAHTLSPIDLDRNRSMLNPMSPDRHIFRHIIDAWSEFDSPPMQYRGYYNNLACPQFPWSQIDRVREEIPYLYDRNVRRFSVETIRQSWASSPITLYVAWRLMWDVQTDVDALLDEFYSKFYGPAREPMRAYLEGLEAAFRDTPHHTGSSFLYLPIFDQARRDKLRGDLEQAAQLAPRDGSLYGERVWAAMAGFERMEHFLDMMLARNDHDFATAYDRMQAFYALNDELADYVLEGEVNRDPRRRAALVNMMERSSSRLNYFDRFFRGAVVSGHQRTVTDGTLVAPLPDEWDFLIDPTEIGKAAGFHRDGAIGGNWQPLKTTSLSWSDQGLHYYKGAAWYRTEVYIPEQFRDRPVYLWFGGIDNFAEVWVNGEYLGSNREPLHGLPGEAGTFRPFDMLASSAVRFGENNTVAVRVVNDRLAELGTGGIVAPVMFWTPNDPDWQPGQ